MKIAMPGDRMNRLTLITRDAGASRARCDCGKETRVTTRDFRSGHTKSCGCLRVEKMRALKTTHGMSESPEFRVWCHMLGRCYNETDTKFNYYGGKGITVCERWHLFANFFADMGTRPSAYHSIDRIDVARNYEPDNCRWATPLQQAQNKTNNVHVECAGETIVVAEAERRLALGKGSITQRVATRGETHQQATDHFARRFAALSP